MWSPSPTIDKAQHTHTHTYIYIYAYKLKRICSVYVIKYVYKTIILSWPTWIYSYIYISICLSIYLYISIQIYLYISIQIYLYISIHIYLYISIHIHLSIFLSIYIYIYIYMCVWESISKDGIFMTTCAQRSGSQTRWRSAQQRIHLGGKTWRHGDVPVNGGANGAFSDAERWGKWYMVSHTD